ncbi:cobalamin binding intrinsic factor-like [Clavelina lepadiformis]|uniref:Uncharacterized protein n=1 Tax=Clavelina lepadiformis TaxID=159417 RepID=A0ABP0FPC2_CLALP
MSDKRVSVSSPDSWTIVEMRRKAALAAASSVDYISVKLSVQKTIGVNISGPYDSTIQVNHVVKESTLLKIMRQAQCDGLFQFETTCTSIGAFVITVDHVTANKDLHQYWELFDANTMQHLRVGVNQYVPCDGQHIIFQISVWKKGSNKFCVVS